MPREKRQPPPNTSCGGSAGVSGPDLGPQLSVEDANMKRFRSAARLLGLVLPVLAGLLLLSPQPADAQAVTGTIIGLVKDSSGAVVPGATVIVVNTGTGFTRNVVSNAQGEF